MKKQRFILYGNKNRCNNQIITNYRKGNIKKYIHLKKRKRRDVKECQMGNNWGQRRNHEEEEQTSRMKTDGIMKIECDCLYNRYSLPNVVTSS